MKIILANPRGFCAGVNMAIESVDQVLDKGSPVYVYHEIVHNRHVVDGFRGRGVTFVDDIDEVPEGGLVVYSAHGISPEVRRKAKERRLVEVDATCPLVTKVHLEVLRYARDGYTIIFIGHRKHDEAIGTVGEAPDSIIVVESPKKSTQLEVARPPTLAYVTQTTLSVSDAQRVIDALKARFPNIRSRPRKTSATPPPIAKTPSPSWRPKSIWSWSSAARTAPIQPASGRSRSRSRASPPI